MRNVIHKFNEEDPAEALRRGSNRPHRVHLSFEEKGAEALHEMLHRCPRDFGRDSSLWTMEMAAEVSFEEGPIRERVSGETIRATLLRMGVRWQRAKHWITSPDPRMRDKRRRELLMELASDNPDTWIVGFCDECWWSRVAHPNMHGFSGGGEPLRLVEQSLAKDDPNPKAISCYGLYMPDLLGRTWLRFVDGHPVSGITTRFLTTLSSRTTRTVL